MKVELLVNLKIASGRVLSAGTVFSDAVEPIPDFIMKRLARGMAKVIENTPAPVIKPVISPVKIEEPVKVPEVDKEDEDIDNEDADGDMPDSVKKVVMKKKIKK